MTREKIRLMQETIAEMKRLCTDLTRRNYRGYLVQEGIPRLKRNRGSILCGRYEPFHGLRVSTIRSSGIDPVHVLIRTANRELIVALQCFSKTLQEIAHAPG